HILVDLRFRGTLRKILVHFDKNGYAYSVDRTNGELLMAKPYVHVNWAERIDLKTGRPQVNPEKETGAGKVAKDICPNLEGGKNQQPAAYSPRTRLFYVPSSNLCMDFEPAVTGYLVGTPYIGAAMPYKGWPGAGGNLGAYI